MRTRIGPNSRVRQRAVPVSPGCSVGAIVAQSVVPNGRSLICIGQGPVRECWMSPNAECADRLQGATGGAVLAGSWALHARHVSSHAVQHGVKLRAIEVPPAHHDTMDAP